MEELTTRRAVLAGSLATTLITAVSAKAFTMTKGIPDSAVRPATAWLLDHYGPVLQRAFQGTPVPLDLACAFACQESAYTWFTNKKFVAGRSPDEMMQLLALDNVSPRCAYPRDTDEFKNDKRTADLAPILIAICDQSRQARGYSPTGKLLYGYGLFQYDLQNYKSDPGFWRDKVVGSSKPGLWPDVAVCADRLVREFKEKATAHPNDLKAAVAAYNGSGENAREYAEIVMGYRDLAAAEIRARGLSV